MDRIGAVLVDTYRIERLIAEGGMGAVYEASHLRIPKKFAIKFLKVSLLDNAVALLRFRREAEVVATLDHPHIVNLFDYNITTEGVPYTVLEYLEGEHLGDRVNRGRMLLVDALRVAEAVAGALTAAHDKGVIHRDLKPENVILGAKGAIKVVDFGIAKLRGGQELTAFNSILGTITYMAPEQLMAGQIDGRADQFALSAIVYEMLSGDMPFGSDGSIPEIAERVLRQQPVPITGYPPNVTEVLLKGMAKDATHRYDNVEAFIEALKEATRPLVAASRADSAQSKPPPVPQVVAPPAVASPAQATVPVAAPPTKPVAPAPKPPAPPIVSAPAAVTMPPEPSSIATLPPGAVPTPSVPTPVPTPPAVPTPPPPAETTAERELVAAIAEEPLPELPGEQTSISMVAVTSSGRISTNDVPTGETEQPPMAAETTRITRSVPEPAERQRSETIRPGELQRTGTATGRMSALRNSLTSRLGRRGGIAVGVIIGVVIAVAASLIWR